MRVGSLMIIITRENRERETWWAFKCFDSRFFFHWKTQTDGSCCCCCCCGWEPTPSTGCFFFPIYYFYYYSIGNVENSNRFKTFYICWLNFTAMTEGKKKKKKLRGMKSFPVVRFSRFFFLNILNAGKLPVNSLFRCVRVNFPLFFLFLSVENDYHFHFSVQHFFFFLK